MRLLLMTGLFGALAGALWTAHAQVRTFVLHGVSVQLEDATEQIAVFYRSMRLNRALDVWNVEVTLSNRSAQALSGPLVLLVDEYRGTTGPQQADGTVEGNKSFYDLSDYVPLNELAPGNLSAPCTLTLGRSATGAPSLTTKVYAARKASGAALGMTRSLDAVGQPLPDVTVHVAGPTGSAQQLTDSPSGVACFGKGAGKHVLKFTAEGYLPVWRLQTLGVDQPTVVPSPRLTMRATNTFTVTPLGGVITSNETGTILIEFSPGAVSEAATTTITTLTGQNLPALLPMGWSPLCAFWLESSTSLQQPVKATLYPSGPVGTNETALLARWSDDDLQWLVIQTVPGQNRNPVEVQLSGAGAYALVVGDADPLAPPPAQPGLPLSGSTVADIDIGGLSATGTVSPPSSSASRVPELVTAQATVELRHGNQRLPSGYLLRGEVTETYLLADGSLRLTPQYEQFIVCYQRPGDQDPFTLHASFPMRPILLFGPEELESANVRVDVLPQAPFDGQVLDAGGGQLAQEGVRLLVGNGQLKAPSAMRLRRLEATVFTNLVSKGQAVVAAFELTLDRSTVAGPLSAQLSGAPADGMFVLARVLTDAGFYGLQPIERLRSDAQGNFQSMEPATGERLPGLIGSGQYVLVQVGAAQGLVSGVARNGAGQVQQGMLVRLVGTPWLTLTDHAGRYQLIAPVGEVEVGVTDPFTGDTGFVRAQVAEPQTPINQDLVTVPSGPRVASISPADNSTRVPRVVSVVIHFNEPVNPATVVADTIRLLRPDNTPVLTALSLNMKNTVATLNPATELEANTTYRINLERTITDLTGLPLEGQAEFSFTTLPASKRDPAAQLIMYEPGATNVPVEVLDRIPAYQPGKDPMAIVVHGTPGVADPEVPVILVNESTGETVTVLSQPDGSFVSVISGGEDDFVSATFVSVNGTRLYVPVSRQQFDNGFVGLYRQGGILEAESDGGPVRVIIEPEAIRTKAKLRLRPMNLVQLDKLLGGVKPQDTNFVLAAALNLEMEGQPPGGGMRLSFPADLKALGYPTNLSVQEVAAALTVVREYQGVKTFEVLAPMTFVPESQAAASQTRSKDRLLETGSGQGATSAGSHTSARLMSALPGTMTAPEDAGRPISVQSQQLWHGMLEGTLDLIPGWYGMAAEAATRFVLVPMILGGRPVIVKGKVGSLSEEVNQLLGLAEAGTTLLDLMGGTGRLLQAGVEETRLATARPLPGAFIVLHTLATPQIGPPGRLDPGMVYATSDSKGDYLLVAPSVNDLYLITATHPSFSDRHAQPILGLLEFNLIGGVFYRNFYFSEPAKTFIPPQVHIAHSPLWPAPGQECRLQVTASTSPGDPPTVKAWIDSVTALATGVPAEANDATLVGTPKEETLGSGRTRVTYTLLATNSVRVTMQIVVASQHGGSVPTMYYPIDFSGQAPPLTTNIPPSMTNDTRGPYVTFTAPIEGGFVGPSGQIVIEFNEAINRTVLSNIAGITLSSLSNPAGSDTGQPWPIVELSDDQHRLMLRYIGMAPDTEYTLTLSSQSIQDISGNPLDQDPRTTEPDSFVMHFRTSAVLAAPLPVENARGCAISGDRLYVLEMGSTACHLDVYHLDLSGKGSTRVARVPLLGFPRDLAVISGYEYAISQTGPICSNELVAVVGGDLASMLERDGTVRVPGQYLSVFEVSGSGTSTKVRQLASAKVSYRVGSAVTKVRWRAPYLLYQEFGSDIHLIGFVNLQAMLIGFNASSAEAAAFPPEGRPGEDANHDGDYVDEGDTLPLPELRPPEFYGKVFNTVFAGTTQKVLDFDCAGALCVTLSGGFERDPGGNVTSIPVRPAYRTVPWPGDIIDPKASTVYFGPGANPRRVFSTVGLVQVGDTIESLHLALVCLSPDADGIQKLAVIDITLPESPRLLNKIQFPEEVLGGQLGSLRQRNDGFLELNTSQHILLLETLAMGKTNIPPQQLHPAIVGFIPAAGAGTRCVARTDYGLGAVAEGGRGAVVVSAPEIRFVQFPEALGLVSANQVIDQTDKLHALFDQSRYVAGIIPARVRSEQTTQSDLFPPNPKAHYYVLLSLPGAAGAQLELTLESLNWAGQPRPSKGGGFAPVRACSQTTLAAIGLTQRRSCEAAVTGFRAFRLSSDPASQFYNYYLSDPFAVIYESLTPSELEQLRQVGARQILTAGSYLRVCIDHADRANPIIGPYASRIDPDLKEVVPVVFALAQAIEAAYQPGPNPPPAGGHATLSGTFGSVSAHNGEVRMDATDLSLPSPRMGIEIVRVIGGQDNYDGPFGLGWDFNYNQRITELRRHLFPEGLEMPLVTRQKPQESLVARSGDLLFSSGQGRVFVFVHKGTNTPPEYAADPLVKELGWQNTVSDYYLPEAGCFDLLVKFHDGYYERLTPDGMRFRYNQAGQLEMVIDTFPRNYHELQYDRGGRLVRITDRSVAADRFVEFGYYRSAQDPEFVTGLDEIAPSKFVEGKICRLRDYCGRDVLYFYNDDGLLVRREGIVVAGENGGFAGRPQTHYLYKDCKIVGVSGGKDAVPLFSADTVLNEKAAPVVKAATGIAGPMQMTVPLNNSSSNLLGQTSMVTQPTGEINEARFDEYGYPSSLKTSDGQGDSTETRSTFNEYGQLTSVIHPEGRIETYTYDTNNPVFRSRGNLLSLRVEPGPKGGAGYTLTYSYDSRYNQRAGDHTDANGFVHRYILSADGRAVEKVQHAGCGEETYLYDAHGRLISYAGHDGLKVAREYDNYTGFLRSVTRGQHTFTLSYTTDVPGRLGMPSTVTPPRGAPNHLKYDHQLRVTEVSRGELVTKYAYNEQGWRVYRLEELGDDRKLEVHLTIDAKGFVTKQRITGIEVDGEETTVEYSYEPDAAGRLKSILHPGNVLQTMEYNYRGDLTKLTWGGYVEEYTHDKHGNVLEVKKGGELVLQTEYDGLDRPTTVTVFAGDAEYKTEYTYYPGGEKRSEITTDPRYGVVWDSRVSEIDAFGRVRRMIINGTTISPQYEYVYQAGSRSIIGPRQTKTYLWNEAGHPSGYTDVILALTYHTDGNGNIERIDRRESGADYTDWFENDELDNCIGKRDVLGELFHGNARADGTYRELINPRGHKTRLEHSAFGELLTKRRQDGMETRFKHNQQRQLSYVGDPTAGFGYQYDSVYRLVQRTLRDGSPIIYGEFDPRDLPQQITTPAGRTERHYDRQARLRSEQSTHHGKTYEWQVDLDALDRTRQLRWRQDSGSENTATYTYDRAGPLLSAEFEEDGRKYAVQCTYNDDLSRKSITYPSGIVVTEERDASGRLIGVSDSAGVIWRVQAWQGNERPKIVQIGQSIQATHQYDARGRLIASRYTRTEDGAVLAHIRYQYDEANNLTIRQFIHRGGKQERFTYDEGERVSNATFGQLLLSDGNLTPPEYERSYSYEATGLDYLVSSTLTGLMASVAPPFASVWTAHNAFLAPTKIDSVAWQTDSMGNFSRVELHVRSRNANSPQAIGATLSHNGKGHLVRIERDDGVVVENRFQPSDLRHATRIIEDGINLEKWYVYDQGARLLEEYETTDSITRLKGRFYYSSGDAPVAADLLVGGNELRRFYYLTDVAGSVVALSDAVGRVVERVRYDTFGQPAIQPADSAAPVIRRIMTGESGQLLIELSEPVLPVRPDPGPGSGIVQVDLATLDLTHAIAISVGAPPVQVPATNRLVINLPGFAPLSVIQCAPSQVLTGQVQVVLLAGVLADEWGNSNAVQMFSFTNFDPAPSAGTVFFEQTADTAPVTMARSVVESPFLFHGQYFDYETGLIYLRSRFYDPFAGMFLEPDPLGYEDSVNHYAAFRNNPVSRRDPTGLSSSALDYIARKHVLRMKPNIRGNVWQMDIDELWQAGGYTSRQALFEDVFARMKRHHGPLVNDLKAAVRRGDISPSDLKGPIQPFEDKIPWLRKAFDDVRGDLTSKGFVKVKEPRFLTWRNGVQKNDPNGGSEIWMRVHVSSNGKILGAETVRIDEFGNPCFDPNQRTTRIVSNSGDELFFSAGEVPHYHAEFVENVGEYGDYIQTGLQKRNPYFKKKHPQYMQGQQEDPRRTVYDAATMFDDRGQLLQRRGQQPLIQPVYVHSHIRGEMDLVDPRRFLTPAEPPLPY